MEKQPDEVKRVDTKISDPSEAGSGSVTGGVTIDGSKTQKGNVVSIDTGGGAFMGGDISTGGGDFVGRDAIIQGPSEEEVARLFKEIHAAIDQNTDLSEIDRNDLKVEVKEIQVEIGKGDFADEAVISRHLRNVQRVSPGVFGDVLGVLANPAIAVSAAVRKVVGTMS